MNANIVHEYFKKETDGVKILIKLNPIHRTGTELTIRNSAEAPAAEIEMRELEFDEEIHDDLEADGFAPSSALEFNLHFSGLA